MTEERKAPVKDRTILTTIGVTLVVIGGVAVLRLMPASGVPYLPFRRPVVEAPEPVVIAEDPWVPALPPSTLNVPITFDLAPVIDALEAAVPREYGSLDERRTIESNDRASVAFELRRTPFTASLQGDVARVSSVIQYRARAWYDPPVLPEVQASCGTGEDEDPPRAEVALSARLTLSNDWTLVGEAQVDRLTAVSDETRDRCRITPLGIDVTDRVVSAAEGLLEGRLPEIELTDDVWLVIDPTSVTRGPTEGRGRTLVASVGLMARPRVVLGPRPAVPPRPLPPLDSAQVGSGLHIHATGVAHYREASARLTDLLGGQVLERQGRRLRIRGLRVSGVGGGRLALEVTFDGTARGRLYLVGTPEYDELTGEVFVPDLHFDVNTSHLLVEGLDWLAHQGLTTYLRERARWPIEDISALAAGQLHSGLNRELTTGVELKGRVLSVDIVGIYPGREHLVVHAEALAEGELMIDRNGS
jgi:hypothetical protein